MRGNIQLVDLTIRGKNDDFEIAWEPCSISFSCTADNFTLVGGVPCEFNAIEATMIAFKDIELWKVGKKT